MSDLVTGEAVALELQPAKLPSRGLAVLIDLTLAVAVYIGVTVGLIAAAASLDDAAMAAVSVASFLLLLVGVPIAVETLSHGRSLGKLACGLRVVRDDGGPIRFRHALVRGAFGAIEILLTFGTVASIASLASERGRRVGDVLAGTLVVRERVPVARSAYVPPPPPWLAGRFSSLDLSGVPDGLWLAVRQYLTRMSQFDQQAGWDMARRLAEELVARTGASVPPGVPPAAFLAAVVHERQSRDVQRMSGGGAPVGYGTVGYGPGGQVPGPYGAGGGSGFAPPGGGVAAGPVVGPDPGSGVAGPAGGDGTRGDTGTGGAGAGGGTGFAPPS
ncbi:RDD family protein [Streptomyces sp. NPDC127068]|uniref:RDD family protein n=1 Tax=Streptomyces sp. NPDC127068 TaxID=3347127 RepID=UPI003652000A